MIIYKRDQTISAAQLGLLFKNSGINRPYEDMVRLEEMIQAAPLLITAWDEGELIGVARSLTDYVYCCYLSDLAVDKKYQKDGVGKELIKQTQEAIGEACSLILLSAPEAMGYYPKVGFDHANNCFLIKRKR
ncbi:GNAT family N-acetyltransferase [Bacillus sp. JCM 19041]|uniref:GNAT family N-acetyltransferase n=1 Tax=Bacillus sp. JCM 19041 TaxID=1460637 RepID=UPI0006D26D93